MHSHETWPTPSLYNMWSVGNSNEHIQLQWWIQQGDVGGLQPPVSLVITVI